MPGYLDSPDYLHMKIFSKELQKISYDTKVVDPCNLWRGNGDIREYTTTKYIEEVEDIIKKNQDKYDEIILLGHSLGGLVSILVAEKNKNISKVISLCPPIGLDSVKSWRKDGIRRSKRDLPEDNEKFVEFLVPLSFCEDAHQYSALESIKNVKTSVVIVVCEKDKSVDPDETISIANEGGENVVLERIEDLGHNFRHSEKSSDIYTSKRYSLSLKFQ